MGSRWRQWQQAIVSSQLWKSIFRVGIPNTNRKRVLAMLGNVVLHLHPVKTRKSGVKMRYTWCAGGVTFFLFLVLTFTGLLLMFYYRPTVEYAFVDILDLREQVPFGIMREVHRWGAHAMVISVWIHMFRVFMTGSYKPPREFNWVIGVILLVLTLLLSFTGYLLPWDQLAIWAITVGSNMASRDAAARHPGPGHEPAEDRRHPARHVHQRRAVRPARRPLRRRRRAAALLRAPLRRHPAHRGVPDGRPLLARPQGRRHLGAGMTSRRASLGSLASPPASGSPRVRARPTRLIPRFALAPAARASSLGYFGRLRAPRS